MKRDLIYIFDKLTFQGQAFGEIQSNFNMSYVIDGTKDSCRLIVWSFQEHEIEPFTIIFHKKTLSWWIVSHDKVERRQNDIGFYWVHNLDLLGAIELFNARDLTDCGFNDNKYTIKTFIERLIALSNFEYKCEIETNNDLDLDKKVDFIKTFENYTLLSALRELLDAYNTSAKLSFNYEDNNGTLTITKAYITLVSKTGGSLTPIEMSSFDDVRETKTLDKNSFGSCVISNADNVMSSVNKTFPSIGSAKLSSTELVAKPQNSVFRLPSKVYKGNWLKIVYPISLRLYESETGVESSLGTLTFYPNNRNSYYEIVNEIYDKIIATQSPFAQARAIAIKNEMLEQENKLIETFSKIGNVTLFEGNKLVPSFDNNDATVEIQKGDNVPYLTKMSYAQGKPRIPFIFTDKATKQMLPHTLQGVAWERGSNLITGFEFLDSVLPNGGHSVALELTDYQSDENDVFVYDYGGGEGNYFCIRVDSDLDIQKLYVSFIVNYIPMSDIKLKVDNQVNKKDIQLYNQNGKLTDNFALSRLINSYAKEISGDNITKFACYYDYNNVPKVGQLVKNGNDYYVINNISINFYQNEDNNIENDYVYYHTLYTLYTKENHILSVNGIVSGNTLTLNTEHETSDDFNYFLESEITMSKNIAVKSLMVNPNTNIRDYGIPQNFNVKRKQVYRDYYELTYDRLSDSDTNYRFPVSEIFWFTHIPNTIIDLTCVMRLDYDKMINNSYTWYYQLETTNYYLNKMFYIMLDFNDNNIIGYGSQNVWSGFVISRIFTGLTDELNTPISYVDANGEFEDIEIYYCTNEQLTNIYQDYQDSQVGGDSYTGSLYNYSVFIPQEIFEAAKLSNKIEIIEKDYNKDAIEVPVFEYACQIGDSNDVIIGDNILRQYSGDYIYFYSYEIGDNITENNAKTTNKINSTTSPIGWIIYNSADIGSSQGTGNTYHLNIRLFSYSRYNVEDNTWSSGSQQTFQAGKDYAFFRHSLNLMTGEENVDLLFIAKKVPSDKITSNNLNIEINHYKLR